MASIRMALPSFAKQIYHYSSLICLKSCAVLLQLWSNPNFSHWLPVDKFLISGMALHELHLTSQLIYCPSEYYFPWCYENDSMTMDLFDNPNDGKQWQEQIASGAIVLHGFVQSEDTMLLAELENILSIAPFRHMITPGGFRMSVAMTNCGSLGWVTDKTGYRYDCVDPLSGLPWPQMPASFLKLAANAAAQAGFYEFIPDACLINRYEPGTKLSLHQDKDEKNFAEPVVSVSLGIPAIFLFGGFNRSEKPQRVHLAHGDVIVWGGPSRLRYHGIMPIKEGYHSLVGKYRLNFTFRKAG